jgi:hypothetical protein
MNFDVDVITVTKNDVYNLNRTFDSIKMRVQKDGLQVNWILIDGSDNSEIKNFVYSLPRIKGFRASYFPERKPGIYTSMNQGITEVSSDFFIMLNSGDILLENFSLKIKKVPTTLVTCFESEWHDENFNVRYRVSNKKVCIRLAKMPNHQAMIFPKSFASWKYDEKLIVSADQEMKLRLASADKLFIESGYVVSSLIGGISARKLGYSDIRLRIKESWQIFQKHYHWSHAIILWFLYTGRFITRIKLRALRFGEEK